MRPVLALALVFVAGFPLSLAITRRVSFSFLLAPLVTALTSTVAVLGMLIVGGPLLPWLIVGFLGHLPLGWAFLRHPRAALPQTSWADSLWLGLPLVIPFLKVFGPPVFWDSHSIWWLHAAYFTQGAAQARSTIADPLAAFSHTDYPPLASATVASAWTTVGGESFTVAQVVTSAVTFSAIALLGYAVRQVTSSAPILVSRLLAVAVSLTAWATAAYGVANGYCDSLWACALAAAAVLLLMSPDALSRPLLPVALMATAALTKNEGLVTVGILAVIVTFRERRRLRQAWVIWLPVVAGLGWMALARFLGATSDVASGGNIRKLLSGDRTMLHRIRPLVTALWDMVGFPVLLVACAAVLGTLFLRDRRRELGLPADGWLWTVCAGYAASLSLTYLISSNEINWYLESSLDRVSLPIVLFAAASAAGWIAVAVGRPVVLDHDRSSPASESESESSRAARNRS